MRSQFKGLTCVPVDLERDQDMLLAFKLDTHLISYGTPEGYDSGAYLSRLKKRMSTYPEGQILLRGGGRVLGHAGFYPEHKGEAITGYIHMLYIVPEARGKGLGQYLLGRVVEHFREQGITSIYLKVSDKNAHAMKLYAAMGFHLAPQQDERLLPMVLLVKENKRS